MVRSLITISIRSWNVSWSRSRMVSVLVSSGSRNPTSRSQGGGKYDKMLALVSTQAKISTSLSQWKVGRSWPRSCLGLKNQRLGLVATCHCNHDYVSFTSLLWSDLLYVWLTLKFTSYFPMCLIHSCKGNKKGCFKLTWLTWKLMPV